MLIAACTYQFKQGKHNNVSYNNLVYIIGLSLQPSSLELKVSQMFSKIFVCGLPDIIESIIKQAMNSISIVLTCKVRNGLYRRNGFKSCCR